MNRDGTSFGSPSISFFSSGSGSASLSLSLPRVVLPTVLLHRLVRRLVPVGVTAFGFQSVQ